MPLVFLLPVTEEEELVFFDGAANRGAELIEVELFCIRGKKGTSVEIRVAEELEETAVELVASGFRRNQNGRAAACAKFSRIVIGEYFELLDRVDGRKNRNLARGQFVVVVAVQQPVRTVGAGSAHR